MICLYKNERESFEITPTRLYKSSRGGESVYITLKCEYDDYEKEYHLFGTVAVHKDSVGPEITRFDGYRHDDHHGALSINALYEYSQRWLDLYLYFQDMVNQHKNEIFKIEDYILKNYQLPEGKKYKKLPEINTEDIFKEGYPKEHL